MFNTGKFFSAILFLTVGMQSAFAITIESGSLETTLNNIQYGSAGDNRWLQPDAEQLTAFRAVFKSFINEDFEATHSAATALGYEVVRYSNSDTSPSEDHYILRESSPIDGSSFTGGGTYVLLPGGRNAVLQVPHPKFDSNTAKQGIETYLLARPRLLMLSGTRRDSSSAMSTCTDGNYSASDVAHQTQSLFDVAHQVMNDADPATLFVQFHGFGDTTLATLRDQCGSANSKLINLSEGVNYTTDPDENSFLHILGKKVAADGVIDACVYGNDTSSLGGTWNVQGRYSNQSLDGCNSNAPHSLKRFIHLEQSYDVRLLHTTDIATHIDEALTEYLPIANAVPVFPSGDAHYSVVETAAIDSSIGFVVANDDNPGDSLSYSIVGGSSTFAIDATTGELTLIGTLDRSSHHKHSLTIAVTDGKVTVHSIITVFVTKSEHASTTGIQAQLWSGISGTDVADLTSNANFPTTPSQTSLITSFETSSQGGSYGQRLHGYLRVTESAEYTFWIASDDTSELRLGLNTDPANSGSPIAWVDGWTSSQIWNQYPSQQSEPVFLIAGRLYYLEALHKEGSGGDHLAVAIQKAGDLSPTIIDNTQMIPPEVVDSVAPTSATSLGVDAVSENEVSLSWQPASDTVGIGSYEVYRDGELIGTVTGNVLHFTDTSAFGVHNYQIIAVDAFGNPSPAIELRVDTSNPIDAVETALQTGDARHVLNATNLIVEAIAELDASASYMLDEKIQLFNLNADGSAKDDGSSLTAIGWDPTHDASMFIPTTGTNTSILHTNDVTVASKTIYEKDIGIIGKTPARYMALGSNPFRNTYRDEASVNDQMHQLMENALSWLTARNDLKAQPFNVVIAHMRQSYYFPDEVATREWLDSHYSGQINYNAQDICDGTALASCLNTNPDLLIISQYPETNENEAEVAAAVEQAMNQGLPVMYLHYDGGLTDLGEALLARLDITYEWDNYPKKLRLTDYDIRQNFNVLPDTLVSIKSMLEHFRDQDYAFDWATCTDKTCDAPDFDSEFQDGASNVREIMTAFDSSKRDIFTESGYRLEKLLALIGDRFRQDANYPMDKDVMDDTTFLKSYFADHAVYNYRLLNPAQLDMGNFSRSNFSHITPITKSVELTSKKNFRSTGAYALPGQTFSVTRNDSSDLTVKVFINTLRSGATHQFQNYGYKRPKFLKSEPIEISPGETLSITSPYGGPIQLSFSENDLPVEVQFDHVGEHPYWTGSSDDAMFTQKLDAGDYDWAEVVTAGFEVHSTLEKMRESVSNPQWGSAQALASATETYMSNYPHVLAGFQGSGVDVVAEIHDFAADRGWSVDELDLVKHMNADQANCGYGCSGNPYDAYWAYNPTGHGDVHELGHGLERNRFRFTDWVNHSQTNPYSYYTKSMYHKETGSDPDCQSLPFETAFNALQDSVGQTDSVAYLQDNYWADSAWSHQVLMTIQMMMTVQKMNKLENGWHLLARLHIHDREFRRADDNDASWEAKKNSLGFSTYSRTEASDTSNDDYMLIALSTVAEVDLRDYLTLWGISYSTKAAEQVASFEYPPASQAFFMSARTGYCKTAQNGDFLDKATLPIDGNQTWPAEIDDDGDGYWNTLDNCPTKYNPRQTDSDNNGIGDLCTGFMMAHDRWYQLALPVNPGSENTVEAIFGDNLPAESYGTQWVIFRYDSINQHYERVELSESMDLGVGYWAIQVTNNAVQIDLPQTARETAGTAFPQCTSQSGCYGVNLSTLAGEIQWNMLGYPLEQALADGSMIRISTNSGACSDDNGCTRSEASTANILFQDMWHYNGNAYEVLGPSSSIQSWTGMWAATLSEAGGLEPMLFFPLH